MKIGLLGGSFNPVHLGHLQIARSVLQQTEIEQIWFVPSGNHPLKKNTDLLDINLRIILLEKALKDNPDFTICNLDSATERPSYTSELIQKLRSIHPKDSFYFIAGYDIVSEIPRWHEYRWLLDNLKFLIINRPGTDKADWNNLDFLDKLQFVEMPPLKISSSLIRKKIINNQSIKNLVPVELILQIESLYR